ncbi:MAG: hypothetical protein MUC93_13705 [Bacteroidales bacterium]|jgi:hypothetical protein|nr:hypothetical protein [Bacteroidales bacterium]
MKNKADLKGSYIINKQRIKTDAGQNIPAIDLAETRPALELLTTEGGESFFNYIDWLGLARDPNLLVLSSMHHYYYDVDDLKDIRTVVNLMPLNQIKQIKGFFHSIYHLIPHKCYFVGCFADHKKHFGYIFKRNPQDENSESVDDGILSRIPLLSIIYRKLDARTDKYLSGKNVTSSLEELGFKVLDMTELNGLTYFCAQKVLPAGGNS